MTRTPGVPGDGPERDAAEAKAPARHHVRLPEFLVKEETGLGEALSKGTTRARIRPCGGCRQRAAALDR